MQKNYYTVNMVDAFFRIPIRSRPGNYRKITDESGGPVALASIKLLGSVREQKPARMEVL